MAVLHLPTISLNPLDQTIPGFPVTVGSPAGAIIKKGDDLAKADTKVHLSKICTNAGWHGDDLKIAMAIAMAESRGDNEAHNYCCHCLFQIYASVWAGKNGAPANTDDFIKKLEGDPQFCANFAYYIWKSSGHKWTAWETFTNGNYRNFMGQDPLITVDKNSLVGDTVSGAVNAVTAPARAIGDLVSALFDPSTYLRLGKGILGGVLVLLGVASLVFIVANRASKAVAPARKLVK